MAKTGQLIVIIGGTGSGKTSFVAQLCERSNECLIFDLNLEEKYKQFSKNLDDKKSRYDGGDINAFMEVVPFKNNGCLCIFEEATSFFSGRATDKTRGLITRKRHPEEKGGRNFIFIFHTIASVPPFLLATANTIILFKTGDNPNTVKSKAPNLFQFFLKLQNAPKYSKFNIKVQ
jgi:hypothetical protein